MTYGLADMEVFDYITPEFLIKRSHLLKKAKCIIVDLNLGKEALNFLCAYTTKHQIKLVITTVSSPKMKNMPDSLHAIDWIITNKDETETYLNLKIESTDDLKIAAKRWNDLGVKNVIVTNGVKELIYRSGEEEIIKSVMPSNSVKDVTGAGDSFCAAVVYSWLNGMSTEDILIAGMVNAKKTIETKYTVRQNLDRQQLYHDMEDYKNGKFTKVY